MEQRKLGPDLTVSALGLGCMGMSEFYGEGDDAESLNVIHRALDLGVTFIDTADMYGVGHNEELVGRALKGRRDSVILATKFGHMRAPTGERLGINGRPDYVRKACDASLQRLGVERIDLYYQHRVDPNVPIEDTVGEMSRLVEEGKIGFLGLSEAGPQTIRRAHATWPIAALQTEYSLWSRDPEEDILPTLRELGIGFVPYSPLGRGFLTGRFPTREAIPEDDYRRTAPRFAEGNIEKNRQLLRTVEGIAERHAARPSQVALAWVLAQGEDIVPIPGTKRMKYLEENADSVNVTLSADDLAELSETFAPGKVSGERYGEASLKMVGL